MKKLLLQEDKHFSAKAKDDILLLIDLKNGDTKCYNKIVEKYKNTMYYMVFRIIKNQDDVDDILQETFLKAFTSLDKYDGSHAFSTWLFRIASNASLDYLRRKKPESFENLIPNNHQDDENNMEAQIQDKNVSNPEDGLTQKEKYELINKIVNSMPDKYSMLIRMRYFEELSYDEISEQTGLALGTVKAQLHRAKEILQSLLSKIEDDL